MRTKFRDPRLTRCTARNEYRPALKARQVDVGIECFHGGNLGNLKVVGKKRSKPKPSTPRGWGVVLDGKEAKAMVLIEDDG